MTNDLMKLMEYIDSLQSEPTPIPVVEEEIKVHPLLQAMQELKEEGIVESTDDIKDQIEKAIIVDGGNWDEYFVRSSQVDKIGYSTKQQYGRSPDLDHPEYDIDYIGSGIGRPALWFYPVSYYLKKKDVFGQEYPYIWLVRLRPDAWLQPVDRFTKSIQPAPSGKERVGILKQRMIPAAIFFKPAFDVVDKFVNYKSLHKPHGLVKGPMQESLEIDIEEEIAYHGTVSSDDIVEFHPLTHFGTEKAAKDRMEYKKIKDGKIYKVDLDIKNPLTIKDFPGIHYDRLYAFELRDKGLISQDEMEAITFIQDKQELRKALLKKLNELGIDGFVYKNKYEDKGNISYVIVDPSQVKVLSVEPAAEEVSEEYTFNQKRRQLNIPELIKRGAFYITHPHGPDGWETDRPDWDFSLITLQNILQKSPDWSVEYKKYIRPESYNKATQEFFSRLSDQKYQQILWSINKLGIPDDVAFLDKLDEAKNAKFVYHVTPTQNLRSVMKNGLVPNISDRSSKIAGEQNGIYLFPSVEAAEDAVMNWLGDEFDEDEPLTLLKVNIDGLEKYISQGADYELIVNTNIEPSRIHKLDTQLEEASPNTLEGSFTPDLVESKTWLAKMLAKGLKGKNAGTIYILGSWYGNMGIFLQQADVKFDKLVLIEPNEDWLMRSKDLLDTLNDEGKLVLIHQKAEDVVYEKPGVVINTSCNETGPVFLTKLPDNMLCLLQARNNVDNVLIETDNLEEFKDLFPLNKIYYAGEKHLTDPETDYTRYMVIGRTGKSQENGIDE